MKTRIISATVVIALTIGLFILQLYVPILLCIAAAILGSVAVMESMYYTKITDNKLLIAVAMLFSVILPFIMCGYLAFPIWGVYTVYVLMAFAICLKFHNSISLSALFASLAFPLIIPAALSCFVMVTQHENGGFFYIILVLCFSAVADTGAYFTGVLLGKHKMSPVISPKKTWEGFAGGIIWGIIATLIVCIIYDFALGYEVNYLLAILFAPIFVVIGVLGDLSASMIKRHCNIKDFGTLIPGHGGIMDRFDSILMIVPAFYLLISNVSIIK